MPHARSSHLKPPVPFSPDLEHPEDNEAETIEGLKAALHDILAVTSRNYGHAVRAVHSKSHAIITAELQVLGDLPEDYAQGLFAVPSTHPALIRISTPPGDDLPDAVSPLGSIKRVRG
jgi:hypothetical protein